MEMNLKRYRLLRDAFTCLERGDWRRFNHNLWLGFGDEWLTVRSMLAETGRIEFRLDNNRLPGITDSGRRFLQELIRDYGPSRQRRGRAQSAASEGGTETNEEQAASGGGAGSRPFRLNQDPNASPGT